VVNSILRRIRVLFVPAFLLALLLTACSASKKAEKPTTLSGTLTIMHAGSLSLPMQQMADAFSAAHPDVKVERAAAGSRSVIRKITELGAQADVVASADYRLIPRMMYPNYANWTARFASNRMIIAFTNQSKFANDINSDNWYEVLQRSGVRFGHSDPDADPCGYRTLMTWQLAESYYQQPGLYKKLDAACPAENVRPKAVELLALLESGELDYAFEYQSVAVQHHLRYINLPTQIDLSDEKYADSYAKATVQLSGSAPGKTVDIHGAPIVYGVTIPTNAPHPRLAAAFLAFMLSPDGQKILQKNGQPPIVPAKVDHLDKVPAVVQPFVQAAP